MTSPVPNDPSSVVDILVSLPVVPFQIRFIPNGPWGFSFVAPQVQTMLGIPSSTLLENAQTLTDSLEQQALQALNEGIASLPSSGSLTTELKLRVDDAIRWLRMEAKLTSSDEHGCLASGIFSDITASKREQLQLSDEHEQLFRMLDSFPGFAYLQAPDYSIKYANKHFRKQFGNTKNVSCFEAIADRDAPCPSCPTFEVFKGTQFVHWRASNTKDDRIYDVYDVPFYTPSGEQYVLEYGIDITEKVEVERKLKLHSRVFQQAEESMLIADEHRRVVAVNSAFEHTTGLREVQVMGKNLLAVSLGCDEGELPVDVDLQLRSEGRWTGEIWRRHTSGEPFATLQHIVVVKDDQKRISSYIATFTNITNIAERHIELSNMAHKDPLTGLPNRYLLKDRISQAIKHCDRHGKRMALLYIDFDGFKAVNDRFGHYGGDKVLTEAAKRLVSFLRQEDTVSRVGGDEFVILLPNITDESLCHDRIEAIQNTLSVPIEHDGKHLQIASSIGVCFYPEDGDCETALIERADKAMYSAKNSGSNCFRMYRELATR